MENDIIEVKLAVDVQGETVKANLLFRNKSGNKIYLNKQVAYYNGIVLNNYFEILNSTDDETDYLGVMANCTRKPDEFLELAPGEEVNSSIFLKEFCELVKGEKYNIQYCAYNPSFLEEQQLIEMFSNKVEITY